MTGKMTPPNDEPAIAKPPAIARRFRKYVIGCSYGVSQEPLEGERCGVVTAVIAGAIIRDAPIPERTD